jgi:hypothetical protein
MPEQTLYRASKAGEGFHMIQEGIPTNQLPKRIPTFYNNIDIQLICMKILTKIDKELYSLQLPHAKRKYFDFYLKGGNASTLHLPEYSNNMFFPYDFQGDFDCEAIVNPDLHTADFIYVRNQIIYTIIDVLGNILLHQAYWPALHSVYQMFQLRPITGPDNKIRIFNEALTPYDMGISERLYENRKFRNWTPGDQCPFLLEVHPNLTYHKKDLNLTLIKLKTRTEPSKDLIDISIPTKLYENIELEWDIHRVMRLDLERYNISFNMSDIVHSYLDQSISAILETNHAKKQKRTMRASKLKYGLQQLLKYNHVPTHNIEALKRLPYRVSDSSIRTLLEEL